MKLKWLFLVPLVAVLIGGVRVYGQETSGPGVKKPRTAEDYKSRTLKEIHSISVAEARSESGEEVLTGNLLPSRVRVTYQGAQRPLSRARREVIRRWAQRYAGDPQHYLGPYQRELQFREDGVKRWLVVNKDLLPHFEKEIRKGEAVELHLIRLGGFKMNRKWEWVLLVESTPNPLTAP